MLLIKIPASESWDEQKEMFVETAPEQVLQLEHSLVSISKWESKWKKPFMTKNEKTYEETMDYIKCMTITQNVKDETYNRLTLTNINTINDYIKDEMTATTFNTLQQSGGRETITSELVYYWMISLNIPMECQKWHINRLLTLIRVCNVKNTPPKKMNKREIASRYASLNAARRQQLNSRG